MATDQLDPTRRLEFREERIGVATSKAIPGAAVLFKRGTVFKSRKYRVWPVAGDDRFIELDPSEFMSRYETVTSYEPGKWAK